MRVAVSITLTEEERATLQRWARGRSVEARLVLRARIILAAAEGKENKDIAVELGKDRRLVAEAFRQRAGGGHRAGCSAGRPSRNGASGSGGPDRRHDHARASAASHSLEHSLAGPALRGYQTTEFVWPAFAA